MVTLNGQTHSMPIAELSSDDLKDYLEQHQLRELSRAYLHRQLDQATGREAKVVAARELAQLYISRGAQADPAIDWDQALLELLVLYPELNDPSIQLGKLLAIYRSHKALFQIWIEQQRKEQLRVQLHEHWLEFRQQLEFQIQLINSLDQSEQSIARVADLLSQTYYMLAWTYYYLGLVEELNTVQHERFANSIEQFRQLLGLAADEDIATVDSSWLDLATAWNARCLIGLGMAAEAANQSGLAENCFERLAEPNVEPGVHLERQQWRFYSFYFPGKLADASKFADRLLADNYSNALTWNSIAIAGRVWIDPDAVDARRLSLVGLSGLAESNRFDLISELMERHQIQLGTNSFYSSWITAQLSFDRFRESRDANDLKTAELAINNAIDFAQDVEGDVVMIPVKWLQATIAVQRQDNRSAANMLEQMAIQYRFKQPEIASRALWMQIQILESQVEQQPTEVARLATAEANLRRWFPESRYLQMVEYRRLRQQLPRLDPQDAIRQLQSFDQHDPNFEQARYDLVQTHYRVWQAAIGAENHRDEELQRILDELAEQVRFFLRTFPQAAPNRKLSCGLLLVDALLQQRPPDLIAGERWINQLFPFAEQTDDTQISKSDFYYYSMTLADLKGERQVAQEAALWLVNHGATASLQSAGLIWQIRQLELDLQEVSAAERKQKQQELVRLYDELIQRLDYEFVDLKQAANLRAAIHRLAELQLEMENYRGAAEHFDRLLAAFPVNKQFLVGAARSNQFTGRTDRALEAWRKLARGAETGSDVWFEAKYYTILSLDESDPHQAVQLLKQTLQLAPQIPDRWQDPYRTLNEKLQAVKM